MDTSAIKGNDPERWGELLRYLDERLQLGLLDRLRRVTSYSLEGEMLEITCANPGDEEYLSKAVVMQQLRLLSSDAIGVTVIRIK
jgi:hypothetical protein